MKKVAVLFASIFVALIFPIAAKATTYQANELTYEQHLLAGDVIELGSGHLTGSREAVLDGDYNRLTIRGYLTARIGAASSTTVIAENVTSYTLTEDMYVLERACSADGELNIELEKIKATGSFGGHGNLALTLARAPHASRRVVVSAEGGTPPYRYRWVCRYGTGLAAHEHETIDTINENNYFDIPDAEFVAVYCDVLDQNYGTGAFGVGRPATYLFQYDYSLTEESEENENDKPTENEENNDTPSESPQIPSSVPSGTVQVSIGADKGYANIKALNQNIFDAINQRLIAELYAKDLKKRANVITQKNLYPPYGVQGNWKGQTHTIKWSNLNVKKGDNVVIIWYTPSFFSHKSTLKVIQATVIEDGTIQFDVPSMGDVSVMSIVKII